jgi:hypothetical protein
MKCKIMLDRTAWISGFLVLAWSESGHYSPECSEDRNAGKYCKKYSRLQTTANFPRTVQWNESKEREQEGVREAFRTAGICRERSILD